MKTTSSLSILSPTTLHEVFFLLLTLFRGCFDFKLVFVFFIYFFSFLFALVYNLIFHIHNILRFLGHLSLGVANRLGRLNAFICRRGKIQLPHTIFLFLLCLFLFFFYNTFSFWLSLKSKQSSFSRILFSSPLLLFFCLLYFANVSPFV